MAKKNTKTTTKAEQTTTYSTRLNNEERLILEEAATLTDVSSSKFIRNATLQASSETLNAAAPNDRAVKSIARTLAKQLLELQCEINYETDYEGYTPSRTVLLQSLNTINLEYPVSDESHEIEFVAKSITPNTMSKPQINKLIQIAQSCPQTFVECLINELQGRAESEPDFNPRVDMSSIAKD